MDACVNEHSNDCGELERLDMWLERWTSFDDFMAVMNHIIFVF